MTDATRRRVMIGTLASAGAVAGGFAGYSVAPEVVGVVASLAVAGFGLGGALGTLFAGGWRSPRPPQPAVQEPEPVPEPEPEPEPPVQPEPEPSPPDGGEPGWYPLADGTRRYWDGSRWTAHVWRDRRAKRS